MGLMHDLAADFPIHGRLYIGGEWTSSEGGERLEVESPATGEVLGDIASGTREDARRAVAAARGARHAIAPMSVWERAALCERVAGAIRARREELARLLTAENGKPYGAEALAEVDGAAEAFRSAAEQIKWLETASFPVADKHKRAFYILQPRGVYAVITPWNFPLGTPAMYYLAPGLATGNAMVWVPALTTSLIAVRLMECLEEAGVPAGVVNLVTGLGPVVGDEIVASPGTDAIAFVGSSQTGRTIAQRGAGKSLHLELGGNGPTIVLEDADVEKAATRIARGCFSNAGQICTSTERILVHERVHDRLVDLLVEEARKVRLGDPFEPSTTMGPLNNERTARKVDAHLADARTRGATVLIGGQRATGFPTSLYYPPTVVTDVTPEMLLNTEETFGPVAPVLRFSTDEEALEKANSNRYGLSGAVFSESIRRAFRFAEQMRCGIVNINETSAYWEPHIPAGGASGTESGIGRTGGRHTLLAMCDMKTITFDVEP